MFRHLLVFLMTASNAFAYLTHTLHHNPLFEDNLQQRRNTPLYNVKSTADSCKDELFRRSLPFLTAGAALALGNTRALADSKGNYLVEPTAEFKEEEARNAQLMQRERKIRADWDVMYGRLKNSNDAETSAKTLEDMYTFIKPLDGIPTGVKKTDLVRTCRKLKYKDPKKLRGILPTWTTPVEIAYEKLIKEINQKMAPAGVSIIACVHLFFIIQCFNL